MRIVTRPALLRDFVRRARRSAETIGFVPTMGALHDGHVALLDRARRENRRLAVSVFVNPLQFGPREDFERYPRNELQDLRICRWAGADWLFMPAARALYPPEFATRVSAGALGDVWEGAVRPGHFDGVLTVVLKLLQIVQPDALYLGQKDAQQAALIAQMIRDFDLPVRVVVCPTVRERDGLALSSRNAYLGPEERRRARGIARALRAGKRLASRGVSDPRRIVNEATRVLQEEAQPERIDYLAAVDAKRFEPVRRLEGRSLLIVAARIGGTRLIDNMWISPGRRSR